MLRDCTKCGSKNSLVIHSYRANKVQLFCKSCGKYTSTNREVALPKETSKEIVALRSKIVTLENKLEEQSNWMDYFLGIVREAVVSLPKVYKPRELETNKKYKEERAVLEFSDVQLGSLVKKIETGGLASYDRKTMRKRINKLTQSIYEVIEIQRGGGIPINHLNIHVLGDIVQGEAVYPGEAFRLDAFMMDQLFSLSDEIIDMLFIPMAKLFSRVEIFCVPGNHGLQGRRGDFYRTSNWDYIVYHLWKRRMAETEHLKFYISSSPFLLYEMYKGQIHCLIHGQQAKGWMGFPYYGVDRMHRRLNNLTGVYISYLHHGHHHQPSMQDTHIGKKIGNGSIEGGSDYSVNDLLTANTPQQLFFGINEKGMTWEYWLRLADYIKLIPDNNGILTKLMEYE